MKVFAGLAFRQQKTTKTFRCLLIVQSALRRLWVRLSSAQIKVDCLTTTVHPWGFGSPQQRSSCSLQQWRLLTSTSDLPPFGMRAELCPRWKLEGRPDGFFHPAFPADPRNIFRYSGYERRRPRPPDPTHHQMVICWQLCTSPCQVSTT